MDKETQRELTRISARAPTRLTKNVTKVVLDTSEEELAERALREKHISSEKKREIEKSLERGDFHREETIENEKVIRELDRYHTQKVHEAIRDGRLSDPTNDPFVRERLKRMEERKRR